MIYCIDTSSLIAAWSERYPPANFPTFWQLFENLVEEGRALCPEDVRREIRKKTDGLARWLDDHRSLVHELDEDVMEEASRILAEFPWLTKNLPGRNAADPFVIALAKVRGATVVTQEAPGTPRKPRIPLVCRSYGIGCLDLLGLIQEESWVL